MATLEKERDIKERQIIDREISAEDYKGMVQRLKRIEFRMRLQELVWFLPFAFLAGGAIGLLVALYSRITPSFTVEQDLFVSAGALLIALAGIIGYALFRPRPLLDTARRTDRALGLKERISTAIEGYNRPKKLGYVAMGARQFGDAKEKLENSKKIGKSLPFGTDKRIGFAALILIPLLGLALFLPNDNAVKAKENEALGQQVDKEVQQIEDLKNKIKEEAQKYKLPETDPKLQELLRQLDQAKKDIQDNKLNREQALASLEKAQSELSKLSDPDKQQAEKAALDALANDLKKFDSTRPAGNALSQSNEPDRFEKAADELKKTADNIDKLKNDPAQSQALADQLEKDAKNFDGSNPDLQKKLNDAAQALRSDNLQKDPAAAQQALKDLANGLSDAGREQQFQQQLSQAQSQLQKSEQQLSQAGKSGTSTANTSKAGKNANFEDGSQDSGGDPSQMSQGDQNSDSSSSDTGQDGQQSGQSQSGTQGSKSQGQGKGQGQGQQLKGDGSGQQNSADSQDQGSGQSDGQGDGSGTSQNTSGQNSGNQGGQNQGAGQGKGAGKGKVDQIYSDPTKRRDTGTQQNVKGKDGQGPSQNSNVNAGDAAGSSNVPYTQVIDDYAQSASEALDKNYVPLTLKDLIKQYFDDLNKRS
jgi:hypothetical protein